MPRYYFDINNAMGERRDEVGGEFSTFEEAWQRCQAPLRDSARDELPDGGSHEITCDVRDDMGQTVYRGMITFQEQRDPVQ